MAGVLMAGAGVTAGTLGAQGTDPRLSPWVGCWTAIEEISPRPAGRLGTQVCFIPSSAHAGLDVVVIANGRVARQETLHPVARREPKSSEGCPGWEWASFSSDDRRLYVRSEFACGAAAVRGSGIYAFTGAGDLLEVRGAAVGANASVRAAHYRPTGLTLVRREGEAVPDSMPYSVVPARRLAAQVEREAIGVPVSPDAVLDAVRNSDGNVVEAWLTELGQGFALSGRELTRLADAGLPPSVMDLMVALSYPKVFAVQRRPAGVELTTVASAPRGEGSRVSAGRRYGSTWDCGSRYYLPSLYAYYDDPCFYGYPGTFGYGSYGAWGGRWYSGGYYSGYYWGPRPIVIVNADNQPSRVQGQAVKGQGYTRRGGASGVSTSRSGSSGSTSSSGSSGSSSGTTSSSSGSTGGGRTAKPRPPK
jgi:hypothetical protein